MDDEIIKLRDLEGVSSIVVTHQLRDAFYVATHMAVRDASGDVSIVPAPPEKVDEAEFIMLKDGLIVFEGDADALRRLDRSVSARPSCRKDSYAANTFARLVGTENRRADDRRASPSPRSRSSRDGRARGFFWQRYSLKTPLPERRRASRPDRRSASPASRSAAVTEVVFAGEQVDVVFEVQQGRRDRTSRRVDRAMLGSVSLLGESAVDITPSPRGTPIPDWGYVPAGQAGRGSSPT